MTSLQPPERASPPAAGPSPEAPIRRRGRPRSDRVHRAILDAARELLIEEGYAGWRLERVAARAGVGKATIYRRWPTREDLALELLLELASPHLAIADLGDTRRELLAAVMNAIRALTETPFGPVIRALLSQIARNPALGDPFRSTVVQARRTEIRRVIERGIARGDLRPDADAEVATELLVGPVYFRLMFGGVLDAAFAERIVDAVLAGFARRRRRSAAGGRARVVPRGGSAERGGSAGRGVEAAGRGGSAGRR
ncbi:MAG TPA: TetR/AcrR family transcriptional regulator, partial [Candidatus Limnocylindrales bacterium]|nr:TetR/AcrR family transcriptional regulator [Candidatus Limnocylindrales bacterium]